MTKEQLLALLEAARVIDDELLDPEAAHSAADAALLAFIGDEDVTTAYKKISHFCA